MCPASGTTVPFKPVSAPNFSTLVGLLCAVTARLTGSCNNLKYQQADIRPPFPPPRPVAVRAEVREGERLARALHR